MHCPFKNKISKLKWTGSSVDFVELIYALHAVGYINNGKATLTELFDSLSGVIENEAKFFSRTFSDIKKRYDRTKFLDELKRVLLQKLKEADNMPSRK